MSGLRVFRIVADTSFSELDGIPAHSDPEAFLWIVCERPYLAENVNQIQDGIEAVTGLRILDLHVSDLINVNLPSHFDFTSQYDQLVFRRLADEEARRLQEPPPLETVAAPEPKPDSLRTKIIRPEDSIKMPTAHKVQTAPVGFVVFDQVLLSVHPPGCAIADAYMARIRRLGSGEPGRSGAKGVAYGSVRLPGSPAELMLHMVSLMVDGYLDLRRIMTRRLDHWQQKLLRPDSRFDDWGGLLKARQSLHHLYELCEDQHNALAQWMDVLAEWPVDQGEGPRHAHDLLLVRSRDIQEHIERVSRHIRELEKSAETAVQIHFNIQSNRTNDVMRMLTAITAVFLPLNLIAGIFGMNFVEIPGLKSAYGFWMSLGLMVLIAVGLLAHFMRKRYLSSGDGR